MNKTQRLVLMVACCSLASRIYLNMFVDGFIIAMSVVMLGIFLYAFKDLNAVKACALVGVFSPLFRLITLLLDGSDIYRSTLWALPDMVFFFSYALFFGIIFKKIGYSSYLRYYLRIALCDFCSNIMEMTSRLILLNQPFTKNNLNGLIILALARSFFITLICVGIDFYKSLLTKRDHEENYKKLILMASTFNSEVYFMEKNMNEIEEIMSNAFDLYKTLERGNYPKEMQTLALEISKDVHEVKKGYSRVIKGLQDNFLVDFKDKGLSLHDIFRILSTHIDNESQARDLHVTFDFHFDTNYIISDHFSLMSILRNLVGNSMDNFEENKKSGYISIRCYDKQENNRNYCSFYIQDDGTGIPENIKSCLFEPGFSTKYNEETGDRNRGLGLTLVHDLLKDKFSGEITIDNVKKGACFILKIPVDSLQIKDKDDKTDISSVWKEEVPN